AASVRPTFIVPFAHYGPLRVDSYLFFFHAEAGIRDRNVTGVQTCALPISPFCFNLCLYRALSNLSREKRSSFHTSTTSNWPLARSEERRVGKECRCRVAGSQ